MNGVCRVLIRSQGRKSLLGFDYNNSSDGMGCGRGGTESSPVHACWLLTIETKDIGELSL